MVDFADCDRLQDINQDHRTSMLKQDKGGGTKAYYKQDKGGGTKAYYY